MDTFNINSILKREHTYNEITHILKIFEANKFDVLQKRGIYIYGAPGSGKTAFITRLLKENNYDIINYDAGDFRNKSIIDNITRNNISSKSVISLFTEKPKPIAIIMDEIDGIETKKEYSATDMLDYINYNENQYNKIIKSNSDKAKKKETVVNKQQKQIAVFSRCD